MTVDLRNLNPCDVFFQNSKGQEGLVVGVKKMRIAKEITNRGRFTMIPNEFWEIKELDLPGKAIWCYLYSMPETWDSSRNNIAKNLNMSVNTVSSYVKKLEDLNMIKVNFGARNCWDFEIVPPSEWIIPCSGTESPTDPALDHPVIHIKEERILKKILKPKKQKSERKKSKQPLVKDEPIPEDLMDYYLILKTVSLHLKFKEHLSKIKEVWPDYELFKDFLSQRKAFFEKNHVITENFHMFKAVLSKAIKEELGV